MTEHKKYSIVYENPPKSKGTNCYLCETNPISFSTNPYDAMIFNSFSEAEMFLELDCFKKCKDHLDGKVMERVVIIRFKEVRQ